MKEKSNRVFLLMGLFGAADVQLQQVVEKYFPHLSEREWKRKAALQQFPFPVYRAERSQKSPWMVGVAELAKHLDKQEEEAAKDCTARKNTA